MMIQSRLAALCIALFILSSCQTRQDALPEVSVYKTPTCECCSKWVDHMKEAGFTVNTTDMDNLSPIKTQFGVTMENQSCHTAIVGGYVVEGHVPADVVRRMLTEKPDIAGIAVPGMPIGSPGMEIEGHPGDRYNIFAFDKSGQRHVYAQR